MTPETFPASVFMVIKLLSLIGILVYAIFAAILVRQEQLMAAVLEEGFETLLRLVTIIHFLAAIAVFILALLLL